MADEWGKMIGLVPQNVYLLDDTIKRNVAFGLGDEEINEELIWSALEQVQLLDLVKDLPRGLDTKIGEMGTKLSGDSDKE